MNDTLRVLLTSALSLKSLLSEFRRSCHTHPDRSRQIPQIVDIQLAAPQSFVLCCCLASHFLIVLQFKFNVSAAVLRILLQDLFQQIAGITEFCLMHC